jgi:membrane protein required for colicin V production
MPNSNTFSQLIMEGTGILIDILIVVIIAFCAIVGLVRGMVKTLISITTWAAAFIVALHFCDAALLEGVIENDKLRYWVTGIVLFIIVLIIGAIVGNVLQQVIVSSSARGIDRSVGLLLGALIGVILVAFFASCGE